ncbi:MAG: biotin--[acetyl-CoA-carboxylase] ligase [Bacteroidales bacterium]|nr:biotin--[acetyl-CoA-carboxylase] ligase [Bacteroidales bacterium]
MYPFNPIIHRLQAIDSTNREAFRLLETGSLKEGTVIVAESQSAGRGQGKTMWESAPGLNLTFSLLLRPVFLPPAQQFLLNQTIALGIRDCLSDKLFPERVSIKWPNDIYCKMGKVSGTLIENRIMGGTFDWCVAGIGINVNQEVFSSDAPNPLSIKNLTNRAYDLEEMLNNCLAAIGKWYGMLRNGQLRNIQKVYLEHLMGLNEKGRFKAGKETFAGTITGVDQYGRLQILDENQQNLTFDIKEVQFLL